MVGIVSACGTDPELPVDRYHELLHPHAPSIIDENIEVYMDFSLGMGEGMRASAVVKQDLFNFLVGRKVNFYRVGGREEVPIPIRLSDREANFLDLGNFSERGSNLEPILRRAVGDPSRTSVFITDFEHILPFSATPAGSPRPHPIDVSAWGQVYFREWLGGGHRLDVFAHRYDRPDAWFEGQSSRRYSNWIYTLVFTPAAIIRDPQLYQESVVRYLMEARRNVASDDFVHFTYATDNIEMDLRDDPINGNANPSVVVTEWRAAVTGSSTYEIYRFASSDLVRFQRDAGLEDRRLITGIRLWSEVEFLDALDFGLRVTDVTQPLYRVLEILEAPAPDTVIDVETGVATVQNVPPELSATEGSPVNDAFEFVYNSETSAAGVRIHPDYEGVKVPTVYRLDLIVREASQKPMGRAEDVFTIEYAGGFKVRALSESIRLALRDVTSGFMGSTVHTMYFIIDP